MVIFVTYIIDLVSFQDGIGIQY